MNCVTFLDLLCALDCTREEVFELFDIYAKLHHGNVS